MTGSAAWCSSKICTKARILDVLPPPRDPAAPLALCTRPYSFRNVTYNHRRTRGHVPSDATSNPAFGSKSSDEPRKFSVWSAATLEQLWNRGKVDDCFSRYFVKKKYIYIYLILRLDRTNYASLAFCLAVCSRDYDDPWTTVKSRKTRWLFLEMKFYFVEKIMHICVISNC